MAIGSVGGWVGLGTALVGGYQQHRTAGKASEQSRAGYIAAESEAKKGLKELKRFGKDITRRDKLFTPARDWALDALGSMLGAPSFLTPQGRGGPRTQDFSKLDELYARPEFQKKLNDAFSRTEKRQARTASGYSSPSAVPNMSSAPEIYGLRPRLHGGAMEAGLAPYEDNGEYTISEDGKTEYILDEDGELVASVTGPGIVEAYQDGEVIPHPSNAMQAGVTPRQYGGSLYTSRQGGGPLRPDKAGRWRSGQRRVATSGGKSLAQRAATAQTGAGINWAEFNSRNRSGNLPPNSSLTRLPPGVVPGTPQANALIPQPPRSNNFRNNWQPSAAYLSAHPTWARNRGYTNNQARLQGAGVNNAPTAELPANIALDVINNPGERTPENPGGQPGRYNFMTDPGYRFRLDEANRALESSAAARGGLLSGGLARRMMRLSQGYASDEYDRVYNRMAQYAGANIGGADRLAGRQYDIANAINSAYQNIGNRIIGQHDAQAAGTLGEGKAWVDTMDNIAEAFGAGGFGGGGSPSNSGQPFTTSGWI